ncbi:hypothetical protein BIY23_01480 [Wolbachia pipientis]|uniref:Uncharacterized protein n=1 Tax=Wolbachia pipientis TaxID=955 RepID=A0A1E7QLN8_WOLPI|nr:hypothetical protein BIY23_01480 [Wolbachia pipientis]
MKAGLNYRNKNVEFSIGYKYFSILDNSLYEFSGDYRTHTVGWEEHLACVLRTSALSNMFNVPNCTSGSVILSDQHNIEFGITIYLASHKK